MKYSSGGQKATGTSAPADAEGAKAATDADDKLDANALGAMAMEAMLSGDMARYEELNAKLERKQAEAASLAAAATASAASSSRSLANLAARVSAAAVEATDA